VFGGRVPYELIPKLFKDTGYKSEEVCCGFKMQTETEEMLEGYSKGEAENGISFDFYRYEDSVKFLKSKKIADPTADIKGDALKEMLAPFKVSSKQALELFRKGAKIGHTVHVLSGKLSGN